jgi:hypothetical protein
VIQVIHDPRRELGEQRQNFLANANPLETPVVIRCIGGKGECMSVEVGEDIAAPSPQ